MVLTETNQTLISQLESQLPKSTLYWFFISIAAAQFWVVYLTFYNSRVFGLILTAIVNKFAKFGHIQIGSFSFSVLSGKIIFRDVHLITEDFSVRCQFGWFIFKWWRPYTPRSLNQDFSSLESRLTVYLEGIEFHVYNRSWYYGELEKFFGLKEDTLFPPDIQKDEDSGGNEKKRENVSNTHRLWRDLIPVTKLNVTNGRFVFGNHLVPNTLIITFEEASFKYTTKPASTPFDVFMHDAKGEAETFRVMFVPSPKYQGPHDEAPRFMGEGFTTIQSRTINIHYYMDEPGLVPHEPEIVELADGETIVRRTYPCIGLDIKCGKNTDVSYGPWADRQREQLWKFFYPASYQPLIPTKQAEPGERRQYRHFEFRMSTTENSTIDILFTKNSETQAIHMNTGHGTYVEANIPWFTEEDGYVSKVKGQLLLVDATTSLQYRSLIECETFEFTVTAAYPTMWNDHQDWTCDFIACKATVCLIFHHKHFFKDLIEDWSVKTVPDIYHFVPYTWTMNLLIKDFELVTLCNEYNWIDTSSQNPENAHIAFTGEILDLSLVLPYSDYLPPTVHVTFAIKGENAFCKLYLPENNTSRYIIQAISESMKIMDRNGDILKKPFDTGKKTWKRFTDSGNGWIDCWRTSFVTLSIGYTYHPMPALKEISARDSATDEKLMPLDPEQELLIPLLPIKGGHVRTGPPDDFDPGDMESDLIAVELEVAPSMLCAFGPILRNFIHIKENYLGEDQVFTDMWSTPNAEKMGEAASGPLTKTDEEDGFKPFDAREYRPFAVTVSVVIHDIHAHLVKNCNIDDLPCPSLFLERLCFEMDKSYKETKLQLLLSPAILVAKDTFERSADEGHLNEGHLGLSGLQVRGHAMFSDEGLPLDSETIEYAWMVEAVIGDLTGKLTSPQLQNLVEFIQTFIVLVEDPENGMTRPVPYSLCQHMLPQPQCRMLPQYPFNCPSADEIKYRMTRASMDSVNFFLVESGTALNVRIHPIKLSTCNLHGTNTRAGITARIEHISFKQYISAVALRHTPEQPEVWLESGGLALGPIDAEAAMALPNPDYHSIQDLFMKTHDNKTKRLWFIWPPEVVKISSFVVGKCGCVGGCTFFGNNRNGISFFHSHRLKEKPQAATLQVSPAGHDPGFGQSLLVKDKLVFEVLPANGGLLTPSVGQGFAFTRGYMSDIASPDSPTKTITTDQSYPSATTGTNGTVQSDKKITSSDTLDTITMDTKSVTTISSEKSEKQLASPSECTSTSLDASLPTADSISLVSRKSYQTSVSDHSKRGTLINRSPSNVSYSDKQGSKASVVGTGSPVIMRRPSRGSMPSPQLYRHEMGNKVVSAASLESERYYSAEEDISSQQDYYSAYSSAYSMSSLNSTIKGSESDSPLHMNKSLSPDTTGINETIISANKTLKSQDSADESDTSTISYEMAQSDQSSDNEYDVLSGEMPANFSLVDLHSQVNKPISQSPVLLSCYSKHLSQYICSDWSVSSPGQQSGIKDPVKSDPSFYSLSSAGQSVQYVHSPACVPHFMKTSQGFTTGLMVLKDNPDKDPPNSATTTSDPWSPTAESPPKEEDDTATTLLQNASITTAVVKLKGSMDVMITPLFLESFQRYAEAVIPTLMMLHPSSIIDGLHSQCLDRLKRQNRLKKGNINLEDKERLRKVAERQFSTESRTKNGEMKTSSIQALFTISKINICVLQSGIVEEVIAFSQLENINELTCTSLLAACIDDVNCQLLSNSHSCKTIMESSPASNTATTIPSPKKHHHKVTKTESQPLEKEDLQVSEICREEDVGTLHISRVHLQLQRILKDSNYSEDVLLTAIPESRSKVLFKFDKDIPLSRISLTSPKRSRRSSSSTFSPKTGQRASFDPRILSRQSSKDSGGSTLPRLFRQASFDEQQQQSEDGPARPKLRKHSRSESFRSQRDENIGFIMFECGLEDINATAVRRLGYKEYGDTEFMKKMEQLTQKLSDIQNSTKKQLERDLGRFETEDEIVVTGLVNASGSNDSLHSWDSRISIPSSASSLCSVNAVEPLKGDASSGILDLNTIWFNFAAPPPMSITRKVDYTKLDWNLLSTATPAINAWLSPFDRLVMSIRTLVLTLTHRTSSVMACVMTDALDIPGIQLPYRSKYMKVTSLSRTLQEDPSCQLLCVLRKYLHKVGTELVEKAVKSDTLPQLITIQKGILALTRQWKNVLYMPHLSTTDFKSHKSVRPNIVTFALPDDITENLDEVVEDGDQFDIVDEKTSLIPADGESIQKSTSIPSLSGKLRHGDNPDYHSSVSGASFKGKRTHLFAHKQTSNTLSAPVAQDIFESPERRSQSNVRGKPPPLARNDSNYSFHSAASSFDQTPPATPLRTDFAKPSILRNKMDKTSDLYQWMLAQQEGFAMDHDRRSFKRQDSLLGEFSSQWSQDDSRFDLNEEQLTMATCIMQLADAQSLFKPFLQSINLHVESVRPSAMMKKFGGSLSLQSKLDFLKIQIADSDRRSFKGKGKKSKRHPRINLTAEMPAFLCEEFSVNIAMKDVIDFETKTSGEFVDKGSFSLPFAMHKLEAKPTTLQVNFMINCQAVTQHVDMPLLRLIHQFVTMAENVKDTRQELKQNHSNEEWLKTHRKQDSKDSTSSTDTQHSDISQPGRANSPPMASWKPATSPGTPKTQRPPPRSETPMPTQTTAKKTNLAHKSSFSSFKNPFEQIRPEKLALPIKKPLLFTKDGKKTTGRLDFSDSEKASKLPETLTPPQSLNLSDTVTIDIDDTSSPAVAEKTIVDEIKETTPKCWRSLYHLLELYSTMPETKTVKRKPKLPVIEEEPEGKEMVDGDVVETPSDTSKASKLSRNKTDSNRVDRLTAAEEGTLNREGKDALATSSFSKTSFRQSIYVGESIPLVVFGIAKVEKVKILAVLSGLKLEAELKNVHASGTYQEKVKGFINRKSSESSATAHIGNTMIVLLEGLPPEMKTVVTVKIGKSQALHTTILRRGKEHNSAMVSIGAINIDIPQHPVVLHDMMARSTRQLSTTLQEFRRPVSRASRNLEPPPELGSLDTGRGEATLTKEPPKPKKEAVKTRPTFLHIHIKAMLQGLTTGASLLPSLTAQHKTGPITLSGITGKKARFTVDLPDHTLSFKSKVVTTETSIPSSASIDLPPIHMYGDYRHHRANASVSETLTEGLALKEGGYLNAVAEVGMLEHSLTTDLLNHLVFVQKVFMKEVNELLQKVSGSDKPVPIWSEDGPAVDHSQSLLYSLLFRFKGIQITATTPTSSAVRLETGSVDLEISNRVQMAARESHPETVFEDSQKVFIKAQIDLNLALGQLLKNPMFEEAEPEFQTMAFFKTKIGIRNALQDEMIPGVSTDQEALLITLTRPIILAHPLAFDKAVLVWLNYKNAYEYWTEQRMALNHEVQKATRQVMDRIPQITTTTPTTLSTLFLQLTVDDMGICLPSTGPNVATTTSLPAANHAPLTSRFGENEPGAALVLTIKSTQISACSSGSLVSKGRFQDFCLRFADDFETSWDDWKPNSQEVPVMNACVVPEGTYEVCSRTINKLTSDPSGNAKWILNVQWKMQGIDVHLDTNIGKRLSALGHTLTALAGEPDEEYVDEGVDDSMQDIVTSPTSEFEPELMTRRPSAILDALPSFVYDTTLDPKHRFRLIEKEMNEQAKIVQDLKQLGASQSTIETESRKLEELKGIVFQDFRREVLKKLKKQSESRTSALKDQLGIGSTSRPPHVRSKSIGIPSRERRSAIDADRLAVYNQDILTTRGGSLDLTRTLPSKVQFGLTAAYSPPETPESLPATLGPSASLYAEYLKDSPTLEQDMSELLNSSSSSDTESSMLSDTESEGKSKTLTKDTVFMGDTDSTSSERLQHKNGLSSPSSLSVASGGSKTVAEPNIDFELDVKVFIDSGKCVLHPKELKDEELKRQQKREKTPTLDTSQTSPGTKRKMKKQDTPINLAALGKKQPQQGQQPQIDNPVFFIPSVDVKVHYNSKTSGGSETLYPLSEQDKPKPDNIHQSTDPDDIFSPRKKPYQYPPKSRPGNIAESIEEEEEPVVMRRKTSPPPPLPPISLPYLLTEDDDDVVVMRKKRSPYKPPNPSPEDGMDEEVVMRKKVPASIPEYFTSVSEMSECRDSTLSTGRKGGIKKANLYAWLSLQSLPEEMVISPCLLDFLEQALEPLEFSLYGQTKKIDQKDSVINIDLDGSYSSLATSPIFGSFPVDVVVFLRVEPSIIRFNCLPSSRVECLLQVPSLEFVFSTKGPDIECPVTAGTPPMTNKVPKVGRERNASGGKTTDSRPRASSTASTSDQTSVMSYGGLSITGGLSDFSMYIFHPYGGGQRKIVPSSPVYPSTTRELGSIQEHGVTLADMARRDMLSLNVEFVKINISRSRKLESAKSELQTRSNVVRFSAVLDIGSAAFKYDMRRLSEILSFPKSWYRRNLARRLFLGDDSFMQTADEDWDSSSSTSSSPLERGLGKPVSKFFSSIPAHLDEYDNDPNKLSVKNLTHHRRASSGDKMKIQHLSTELNDIVKKFPKGSVSVPQSPTDATSPDGINASSSGTPRDRLNKHRTSITQSDTPKHKRPASGQNTATKSSSTWETLVLFAVNIARLDLNVNMSNVMGNTVWSTKQIKSHGRLSIDSSGHRDMKITAGMSSSHFDSRGGVVGGNLDINDLNVFFEVNEDPELGKEPDHRAGLVLKAIECRMDYMGTSVLMTRLSNLDILLHDEWHIDTTTENDEPVATNRPALLFAHGELKWGKFHIMISRSTTSDIVKMVSKIEEFFTQQFTSSKRVLSAFGPIHGGNKRLSDRRKMSEDGESFWDIRLHRHWQKALELVTGCRFSMLPSVIPKEGIILGGNMTFLGEDLALACFHGINFRAKSWAIFSVMEPYILFSTEAQKTPQQETHVVQDLTFNIGHDLTKIRHGKSMCLICKLSRGHSMPPTFTSVQEWFHYAFSTPDIKGLDDFPQVFQDLESPNEYRRSRKVHDYNHESEIIFALPCLQMHMKSIHNQSECEPQPEDPRPVVECGFITEFEDHIFVAMDAEVILFLHDLVSLYIKEKDVGVSSVYGQAAKAAKSPDSEKKKVTDPTAALKQDWREFACNTWQLEPTVRLLHWASKQIDPVGVDYVLQKLGFTHARVTIPKWMQRGFMDPMDKFTSFLIERLISMLKEKQEESENT